MSERWLHKVAKSGNYNDLENKPISLPANGGNADTVNYKEVNDTITTSSNLWTSEKTNEELEKKANKKHTHKPSEIEQDSNNRFITDAQLDTLNKSLSWQGMVSGRYFKDVFKSGIYFTPEGLDIIDSPDNNKSGTLFVVTSDPETVGVDPSVSQKCNTGLQIFLTKDEIYMRNGHVVDQFNWLWGDWFALKGHKHKIANATNSSDGLMSSSDKIKIDNVNKVEKHMFEPKGDGIVSDLENGGCYYSKCNNFIEIHVALINIEPSIRYTIYNLPEVFRPDVDKLSVGWSNYTGLNEESYMTVKPNGDIEIISYTTKKKSNATVTFIATA